MFTVRLQVLVFPDPSVAVNVTTLNPIPVTTVPTDGDWVKVAPPQLSNAVVRMVRFGMVAWQFAFKGRIGLLPQVNVGGSASTLSTLNIQVLVFPDPSVAVNVTVVMPVPVTGVPTVGDCAMEGAGAQLSVAVAPPV
jgi:hypothetical protein